MPLYTNIETELKPYCSGVSLSLQIADIAASRDFVERQYIKKEIGADMFNTLQAAYTASIADTPVDMSNELQALWEQVMAALGPLSVWHFAGANAAELGSAGARERDAEDGNGARLWVSKLQRDTLYEQGMNELDNLLAFLDENKADYDDWANSTAYINLKKNLLQTTAEFNEAVNINNSRRLFKALKPAIKQVEFLTIRRYIGEGMYNRLVTAMQDGDATTQEAHVRNLLLPAIANMAFALCSLPIEAGTDGVYMLSSGAADNGTATKTTPADNVLFELKRAHQVSGMQYLNEAVDYLNKTATDSILSEYFESPLYADPNKSGYSDLKNNNDNLTTVFAL